MVSRRMFRAAPSVSMTIAQRSWLKLDMIGANPLFS
jgi:hypothetical protein